MIRHQLDKTALIEAFRNCTEEQLGKQLDQLAASMGEQLFGIKAASLLMSLAHPEDSIPSNLKRFVPLVRDGIEMFLSRTSYFRLRRVLLSQSSLMDSSVPGERLLNLALHFPTLHKLGQLIARNPNLDPKLKKWLIHLEQGTYGTDPKSQVRLIAGELTKLKSPFHVTISPHILAEASVATVLPCSWRRPDSNHTDNGIFKVLKPEIENNLLEELHNLEGVVSILEQHRELYALQEMKLADLFKQIHTDLAREINLTAEQQNLAEASNFYDGTAGVRIPKLAPFCTPIMTSMEYIEGKKITDIKLTFDQRQTLARKTFETIICIPLFAKEDLSLFHGDPHAGNILAVPGTVPGRFDVALLDWTLAGHLSKRQRVLIMELLLGIVKNDIYAISRVIEAMALREEKKITFDHCCLAKTIEKLLAAEHYDDDEPLKKIFRLLEELAMEGLVFPSELILYRKSFFTLEGVLNDISPNFAMSEALEGYLARLLVQELPTRCGKLINLTADTSEEYRTLLSNRSLLELSLYKNISIWQQTMQWNFSIIEAQVKLSTDIFMAFTGYRY